MSKEKQIEEMAKVIQKSFDDSYYGGYDPDAEITAEDLYNAGYRKQKEGEWIRYPHNSGIYCSLCKHKRRYRDIHDAFCPKCGAKMKGGAE